MPKVDWKWFLVGALFAFFVLPLITGFIQSKKVPASAR